jgi:hypothetical protein
MGPLRFSSAKVNTTVRPIVFPFLLAVTYTQPQPQPAVEDMDHALAEHKKAE